MSSSWAARTLRWAFALVVMVLGAAGGVHAQARYSFDSAPGFLPKTVVPAHYGLHFDLDPARDDFGGRATIAIRVREPVDAIVLHARQLDATDVRLLAAGRAARRLTVAPDPQTETWRLVPPDGKAISAGRYTLQIAYRGSVNRSDEGLFRIDHQVAGAPVRMLATQLEATYARRLFPSFDEPSFRARFDIEISAPRGYRAASNMPETFARSQGGDMILYRFAQTPPIPTYLVALTVGHLDALAGRAAGVPLRILVAEGKRDEARYALEVTERVLPFYSDYFDLPFALPKLDQLAVPGVREGAMEDWGLISYSEPAILFEPSRSSDETRRQVFSVMAHEIAHQWFGDLVTASSWEEIWLNEAFATWMATKATDRFNPQWQIGLRQREQVDRSMTTDAGPATRAIRSGPVSESGVYEVFDGITYTKGGAVLAMLEQWIGPEVFRKGLAAYMAGQKFSNATAGDLWHYMGEASRQDVAGVAASWTDQKGFPVVSVRWTCDGGDTRVTLAQSRFASDRTQAPDTSQRWKIPVRLQRGDSVTLLLLTEAFQSLSLPGCTDAPLVVNPGGVGFYRVAYAPDQTGAPAARFAQLAPADKITLFSDTFALAQAGRAPIGGYFALLAQLPQVTDASRPVLFTMASHALSFFDETFTGTPLHDQVRTAARQWMAPELARLGWDAKPGDDAETRKLRAMLIRDLAYFDDAAVAEEALRRFDLDQTRQQALDPSIRDAVVEATGMHADRARFDQLLGRLKATDSEEERWLFSSALAGGRDEARAGELLGLTLSGTLPPNISVWIVGMVAEHSPFADLAYAFTLAHWDELAALSGSGPFGGRNWLLPNALGPSSDVERATRMLADQQAKAGADGKSAATRAAAQVRLRAQVRQGDAQALASLLAGAQPVDGKRAD